jgi:hypothetical protein
VSNENAWAKRGEQMNRGIMQFMALLTFGMPIAVIAAYYIGGWKAAVLAFPFLFVGVFGRFSSSPRSPVKTRLPKWVRRSLALAVLVGIPLAAVGLDEPQIMRLWAYAIILPFSFGLAFDRNKAISRAAPLLAGAIFLALSEMIWLFGSIAGWIWFHAFAMPIFMFLFSGLTAAFSEYHRDRSIPNSTRHDPPPRAQDDHSANAWSIELQTAAGERRRYTNVSLSQAQAIFQAQDWGGEYEEYVRISATGKKAKQPAIYIIFSAAGNLILEVDGPSTMTAQWMLFDDPPRGRLLGTPRVVRGQKIPLELVPQLMVDSWDEAKDAFRARLEPFVALASGEA